MNRHAYLIIAHNNFEVLKACLRMVDDPRNDVFLLLDKKSKVSEEVKNELKAQVKVSRLEFVKPMVVNWGAYSLVEAELRLLEAACRAGEYSYMHYFQGVDLPIKTQDHIHRFFDEHQGTEFVNIDFKERQCDMKCMYHHIFVQNRFYRHNKFLKVLNYGLVYTERALKVAINKDIKLFHGSALFSITGEFAQYVVDHKDEMKRRYKYSLAPDDVFIHSLLMASPFKDKLYYLNETNTSNARLIDRKLSHERNSPHVWEMQDTEIILGQPDHICFSRKFNEQNIDMVHFVEQTYGKR